MKIKKRKQSKIEILAKSKVNDKKSLFSKATKKSKYF